ncbi:MAG: TraR/DksA C4-type zinc finger protein [Patescibacteria group bacterium]
MNKKSVPNVIVKNGRWPIGFLNSQKKALLQEQADSIRWHTQSLKNIRDLADHNIGIGDEPSDISQVAQGHAVAATELTQCASKLLAISSSIAKISKDIKSKNGKHYYGRCTECDEFITVIRLLRSAWVEICVRCQETKEAMNDDYFRNKSASPFAQLNKLNSKYKIF